MYQSPPPIRTPSIGWLVMNITWRFVTRGPLYATCAGAVYGMIAASALLDGQLHIGLGLGAIAGCALGLGFGGLNGALVSLISCLWFRPLRRPAAYHQIAGAASAATVLLAGALASATPLREALRGDPGVWEWWPQLVGGPTVIGCALAWRVSRKATAWYERFCASSPRQ